MNTRIRTAVAFTLFVIAGLAMGSVVQAQTDSDVDGDEDEPPMSSAAPWPDQFKQGEVTFTVYPPELDRWQGDRLEGRAAVAVQPAGAEKPVFGVVTLSARTEVDNGSGTVTVRGIRASRASFPTATDRAGVYLDAIRQHLAAATWNLPLDRLRADLAIDQAARQTQAQPLRNDPPRIIYTQSPTILVPVDGPPVLREMMGLQLSRVLNTRALLLLDKPTGRYYLFVAGRWMDAPSLDGPWTEAQVRPTALEEAKQQAVDSEQVDLLEGSETASGRAPQVIVSTVPAELVQTDGPPQYSPIERTQLLYVTNSPNRLFLDLPTQQYYVLLAGRWYRTRSLQQGGWDYVAGANLPEEFALIPDSHPTESVRAAVPGTPQAQEAVIANSVPQVATVKRTSAKLEITYDGPPQFRPIEGTSLESAVNAPVPVIRVDWHNFYALDNGVWFFSDSPDGPWSPATSVPAVVYTIPRSSPLHYVTYVRIYGATPDDVYVGYTPGYVGSYVTTESTVVYGTGWYYRPWIGTVWYGPPVTWGFGFTYCGSWWNPWPFWGPALVVRRSYPRFHPWWGPWHSRVVVRVGVGRTAIARGAPGPRRVAVNNTVNVTNIYRRWGPRVAVANSPVARPPARLAAPAGASAPGRSARGGSDNPDWRVYRQRDGQWQRFAGNGQWENAQRPQGNVPRWMAPRDSGRVEGATPRSSLAPSVPNRRDAGMTGAPVRAAPDSDRSMSWRRDGRRDWMPRAAVPPAGNGPAPQANTAPQANAAPQAPRVAPPSPRFERREPGVPRGPAAGPVFVPRRVQPSAAAERPVIPGPSAAPGQERPVINLDRPPMRGPAVRAPQMQQPGASMGGPVLQAPRAGQQERGSNRGGGGWRRHGDGVQPR